MSSSFLPSTSFATQRRTSQKLGNPKTAGPLDPCITPAPNPRPIFQFLAFGLIIFLALLQLLPATHFRDPFDPFRNWAPLHSNPSSPVKFSYAQFFYIVGNFFCTCVVITIDALLCVYLWLNSSVFYFYIFYGYSWESLGMQEMVMEVEMMEWCMLFHGWIV
jgi:hypothetical protein